MRILMAAAAALVALSSTANAQAPLGTTIVETPDGLLPVSDATTRLEDAATRLEIDESGKLPGEKGAREGEIAPYGTTIDKAPDGLIPGSDATIHA